MDPFVGEFNVTRIDRVISGPGKVRTLRAELERWQRSRAIVVTGRTLGASPLLTCVTDALGSSCVGVFDRTQQHVPSQNVCDLAAVIRNAQADCVVSFGGGSPIDAAKIALHELLPPASQGSAVPYGGDEPLIHIAIPTTLSAGEYTMVAGITDETTRIKRSVFDARLAPRTVIADPELTLDTPDWLWVASGIRALDHAVEATYSVRHHPISDTLATKAIALLLEHLPASIHCRDEARVDHRSHCLMAAWLAVYGMTNAGFGLSHAFGHQIGPRWDVAHGVTSCIMLPHAMRFMAGVAAERFGPIAEGFGIPFNPRDPQPAALACAERAEAFIARFNLPQRLRDVAVPREQLTDVAAIVQQAMARAAVVDRTVARDELVALLVAAY